MNNSAESEGVTSAPDGQVIGATAIRQRVNATRPATGRLTTRPMTTQPGSLLLVSVARGLWSAAPNAPADDRGNAFTPVGPTHPYQGWPTSQTGLYVAPHSGAGRQLSMAWGDIGGTGDEVTLSAVEVRGVTTVESSSWVERTTASELTSDSVTTAGPAVLVAWWWGSGNVRTVGSPHLATPGSGFTLIPGSSGLISLGAQGYIQVAVAYRVVDAAGTYTASWSTDAEGAQLYLVALR